MFEGDYPTEKHREKKNQFSFLLHQKTRATQLKHQNQVFKTPHVSVISTIFTFKQARALLQKSDTLML